MYSFAFLIAFAAAFALASPALAETGLQRLRTADDSRGLEAVGRLNIGETGFCTASLIAPEIALTAAHCVHDQADGRRIDRRVMEFQIGLRLGRAEAYRGIRRVIVHPEYDSSDGDGLDRIGRDLALLELDRPVRIGRVQPFGTASRVRAGQIVQVVSYGRGRADAPSRESDCTILTRDAEVLVLDCTVDFGSSGAPVFVRDNGTMRIASVMVAKARWRGRDVALAAETAGHLDLLLSELARPTGFAPVGKHLVVGETAPRPAIPADGSAP